MYRSFTLAQMIEHFTLQRIMSMFIVLKFEIQIFKDSRLFISKDLGILGHRYLMFFITGLQPLIIVGTDLP